MKRGFAILIIITLVASVLTGAAIASRANDDTPEDATQIILDEKVNDSLDEVNDEEDWFKIDLVGGDLVRIYMTFPATVDFDVALFDSNEGYINSSEGVDTDEEIIFGVEETGLYYILAYSYEGADNYELEVTKIGEYASDGDDTAGNATEISLNELVQSDLDPDKHDSMDWYKISLNAGDVINGTFNMPATGVFEIAVYDPNLDYLDSLYMMFQPVAYMEYGVPRSGYYFISIQSMMGGGDYSFTLRKVGTFTPDGNDDRGNATRIDSLPDVSWDAIGNEYDEMDWFVIDLNDGDNVTVLLDVPDDADLDIRVGTEDVYYAGGFGGTGEDERVVFEAESSESYYIQINFYSSESDFPVHYSLALDYTDNVMEEDDDNSFGNATSIDPPESFTDEMHHVWDPYDFYCIEAGDEGEEVISLDITLPADSHVEVTLWDSDGVWLDSRNISRDRRSDSISFGVAEEDDYYIVLNMFSGSGAYAMDADLISNNLPPEIVGAVPAGTLVEVNEGESVSFSVTVQDEEIDDLEFEWYVDNQRQYSATDDDEFTLVTSFLGHLSAGDHDVEVIVSDDYDKIDDHSWVVRVIDVNRLPEIIVKEPLTTEMTINETESIFFEIEVSDPDLTTPLIQWILNDENVTDETEDTFEYKTDFDSEGSYVVAVNVVDAEDDSIVNSTEWKITVLNTDRAPVLTNITPWKTVVKTDEENPVEFKLDAADPDGEKASLEWYFDGKLQEADGTIFIFTPDYDSADGTDHTVMVVVTAGGMKVNNTWTLTINNVNRKPMLDNTSLVLEPDTILKSGKDIEFHIEADDPDGGELTYRWFIKETGETFDNQSFYHTLPNGIYNIRVTVTDETGDTDEYSFVIEVDEPAKSPGFGLLLLAFAAIAVLAAARYSGKRR